ncbi:MAG TPA: NAD(P)H-quinone oxidoreductase [Patescibacteria group bacterium]|nr:NAD(P)H-quinone oxidoreductase [Patescibacteria group bacterium]
MRAAAIHDQKLIIEERPIPAPGLGEVLVRVAAAGVNRPDLLQRKGLYPPPAGITDIPGLELSGEVVALGRKVTGLKKGAKICALVAGGSYAEYCVVPAPQCLPVPKGMDMTAAAGLAETHFTVWTNLVDRGKLKKGETILIHGGASGIGTTAIQVARALGAKVFATAGTDEKCRACEKLGASAAINYKSLDYVAEINKLTGNRGVDVVLDMVGGDYVGRNQKVLASHGRHVSIAMQKGRTVEIDLFQIMSKRLVLTGSTLRPQPVAVKGEIARALKKTVWPLLARKKIKVVIDRVYPFEEAQAAHEHLEAGNHVGKVILTF